MPRLPAVWATTQLFLTLGTAGWGVILFLAFNRNALYSGGNFAAAAFFLVAAYLFGRDHPDGRLVGVVGLLIFLITNGYLIYEVVYAGLGVSIVDQDASGFSWTRAFPWFLGLATAFIAIPEALLLAFGHRPPEPEAATPPPPT